MGEKLEEEGYQILTADTAEFLENQVKLERAKGWKLQGGVSVCQTVDPMTYTGKYLWSQAMVKEA